MAVPSSLVIFLSCFNVNLYNFWAQIKIVVVVVVVSNFRLVTSPELSLIPFVYQRIRRPKKQDWCDKQLFEPRKLDLKNRTRTQSRTRSKI